MKSRATILAVFFLFISLGCEGAFDQTEGGDFNPDENVETFQLPGAGGEQPVVPVTEDPVDEEEEEEEVVEEEVVEEEEPVEEEEVPDPNVRPEPGSVVMFEIPAGTGNGAWNSFETPAIAYVGQILLIVNNDGETHQLHVSGGGPTNHGQPMAPGASQEFELNAPSALEENTRFYDHIDGGSAGFWLEIRP